jgi:hypothetical protein
MPSEGRAGLGITAAQLLGTQSGCYPEFVGRNRRHLLPPKKFDDDGGPGDKGARQEDALVAATFRADAPGEDEWGFETSAYCLR